jgi:hypothetical protein
MIEPRFDPLQKCDSISLQVYIVTSSFKIQEFQPGTTTYIEKIFVYIYRKHVCLQISDKYLWQSSACQLTLLLRTDQNTLSQVCSSGLIKLIANDKHVIKGQSKARDLALTNIGLRYKSAVARNHVFVIPSQGCQHHVSPIASISLSVQNLERSDPDAHSESQNRVGLSRISGPRPKYRSVTRPMRLEDLPSSGSDAYDTCTLVMWVLRKRTD